VGNYQPEHVFALGQALDLYDFYQARVDECDAKIEEVLAVLTAERATLRRNPREVWLCAASVDLAGKDDVPHAGGVSRWVLRLVRTWAEPAGERERAAAWSDSLEFRAKRLHLWQSAGVAGSGGLGRAL
jgi:hypothetical protein